MRFLSIPSAVLVVAICAGNCVADDADRLMKYFSFFEGGWDVTDSEGNTGILKIAKGVTGQCHVLSYSVGDDKSDEVCGYVPSTKKWTCAGFSETGRRYAYEMDNPPRRESVRTGDRFTAKSRGFERNGAEASSRLEFIVTAQDTYAINITEIMSGDEKRKDVILKLKRRKELRHAPLNGDAGESTAPKIRGTILYNGRSVTEQTPVRPSMSLHRWQTEQDGQTRQRDWFSADLTYDAKTGNYTVHNVPAGKWRFYTFFDTAPPYSDEKFPGDFCDSTMYNSAIVPVGENVVIKKDLRVVKLIRLTKPIDGCVVTRNTGDPPDILTVAEASHFAWDPIPGADHYEISFLKKQGKDSIENRTVEVDTAEFREPFSVTKNGEYYMLLVRAKSPEGHPISSFRYRYKNGHGGWYRFRVVP